MHLAVLSYKPCWVDPSSPSGFATDGGFPFQMAALAELFETTSLVLPRRSGEPPPGAWPLTGTGLRVTSFAEPPGQDTWRKLALLVRLPWLLPFLWREVGRADVVHAVVPGDVGGLAVPLALMRRKRLFVRHCGTWGRPTTVADRVLERVLVGLARRKWTDQPPVILATGGAVSSPPILPEERAPAIRWIFSTTLTAAEVAARPELVPPGETLHPGETLRSKETLHLASVGRLTSGKNIAAAVRAAGALHADGVHVRLDVVGHGPERAALEALARETGANVRFHGNLSHDEVLATLDRAHVLVFPTRVAEGFPKAVLEAMTCGAVVVAPRVSVLPALLGDGRGVLLDDTSPEAVTAALRRLVADPDDMARRAAAARQAAAGYTLEAWRDEIGNLLCQAWGPLGGDRGGRRGGPLGGDRGGRRGGPLGGDRGGRRGGPA